MEMYIAKYGKEERIPLEVKLPLNGSTFSDLHFLISSFFFFLFFMASILSLRVRYIHFVPIYLQLLM